VVRFGNLAMMPWEPIKNELSGIEQESFLVEARSLSGFSGSPVYVYNHLSIDEDGTFTLEISDRCYLLGVDWCHLSGTEPVRDQAGERLADGSFVRQNSGMMGVIPAWKLVELLNTEEVLKVKRDWQESRKTEKSASSLATADDEPNRQ
jgi:hypothetical protein